MRNDTSPKGPTYAREAIALIASKTPSLAARKAMTAAAMGRHGNYTQEAKALWAAYAADGCPRF